MRLHWADTYTFTALSYLPPLRGLAARVEGAGFDFRYELVREVLTESISPACRRLVRQLLDPLPSSAQRSPAAPPPIHTRPPTR